MDILSKIASVTRLGKKEQYNNFGIFANEVVGNELEYTEILNRFLKFMIVIMHSVENLHGKSKFQVENN